MLMPDRNQMMKEYIKNIHNDIKPENFENTGHKFSISLPPSVEPIFSNTKTNLFLVIGAMIIDIALSYLSNNFIKVSFGNFIAIFFILLVLKDLVALGYGEGLFIKETRDRLNKPIKHNINEKDFWKN